MSPAPGSPLSGSRSNSAVVCSGVSNSCPSCGTVETFVRSELRFCPRCDEVFAPRARSVPTAIYTAVYGHDHVCSARVIYPFADGTVPRTELLDPRFDVWKHSPTGFGYGYTGSGPAQLSLGILAHFFGAGREELAVRLHQVFKRERVATTPISAPLVILSREIASWAQTDAHAKTALAEWSARYPFDVLSLDSSFGE